MDLVNNIGKMALNMQDIIKMDRKMDLENINGVMDKYMMGNGRLIKFVEKENIFGLKVEHIKANG